MLIFNCHFFIHHQCRINKFQMYSHVPMILSIKFDVIKLFSLPTLVIASVVSWRAFLSSCSISKTWIFSMIYVSGFNPMWWMYENIINYFIIYLMNNTYYTVSNCQWTVHQPNLISCRLFYFESLSYKEMKNKQRYILKSDIDVSQTAKSTIFFSSIIGTLTGWHRRWTYR